MVPRNSLLAGTVMPVIMPLSPLLPVVGNFKTNAIRAFKEGCRVVARILRIQPGLRCLYAEGAKLIGYRVNISRGIDTQAEVMQTRSVRILLPRPAGPS